MPRRTRVELKGRNALKGKLTRYQKIVRRKVSSAIETAVDRILKAAQNHCPVDTGRLRASLYKVFEDVALHGEVRTDSTHYAKFVHFGTRYMKARPFLYRAFLQQIGWFKRRMKQIPREAAQQIRA